MVDRSSDLNTPLSYDELMLDKTRAKYAHQVNNTSMCELDVVMEDNDNLPFLPLMTDMRVTISEQNVEGTFYTIGFSKLTVMIDPIGYQLSKKNRYGEISNYTETVLQTREAVKTKSLERNNKFNFSTKDISGGYLENKDGASLSMKGLETREIAKSNITPTTFNRWVIQDPHNNRLPIEGTIINTDPICELIPTKGANQNFVSILISFLAKDLVFIAPKPRKTFNKKYSVNRDKLLKALAAKCLRESSKLPETGAVPLDSIVISYASLSSEKDI